MKWATKELHRLIHIDNKFRYVADLTAYLHDNLPDLRNLSPVEIAGSFQVTEEGDRYEFDLQIDCTVTMPCAITLEEVLVPMHFETQLVFGNDPEDDSMHPLEGHTIDLDPYVFAEIVIEMPMRVTSEHAYDQYAETIIQLSDEEKSETNPFTKLKK